MAALLAGLGDEYPHTLEPVDIDADPVLRRRYGWAVPVVVIDRRYRLAAPMDQAGLRAALARAQRR